MKNGNRPKPSEQLYKNLFWGKNDEESIQLIAEGLVCLLKNSKRLIEDTNLLVASKRFASARFLLTTANEEMAKIYILLDMCRLDFKKNESLLRKLCGSFYNHVLKHAYVELHRRGNIMVNLRHAKENWEVETTKWWPNDDPESGEPDMPHATVFSREMPLYVDYIEYDQEWWLPSNEDASSYFGKMSTLLNVLDDAMEFLKRVEFSHKTGLLEFTSLKIFHDFFQTITIKEDLSRSDLVNIYQEIGKKIFETTSIPVKYTMKSIYVGWPLYNF